MLEMTLQLDLLAPTTFYKENNGQGNKSCNVASRAKGENEFRPEKSVDLESIFVQKVF